MTYKLIFKGELKDGRDQADVVSALAKLLKKSPALIHQRLFTGQPVPIRRVGTREQAQRYVAAFDRAGAVLHIAAEPEFDAESPPPARQQAEKDDSRLGLKVAAWLFILLLFLGGGAAWWSYPIWSFDEDTEFRNRTAAAMTSDDLVALANVDVQRTTALEERLFGAPDTNALLGNAQGLLSSLARFGLDIRRDVSDVLLGLYRSQADPNVALVVLGEFDVDAIRAWMDDRFDIERVDDATQTVYFSWLHPDTCEPSPLHALRLEPSRLLMAPAERLPALTRRMDSNAAAAHPLGDWRARADMSLATAGVFGPQRLGGTLTGLPGMLLASAGNAAAPARSIILSAKPIVFPPGITVDATLFSDNPDFLQLAYTSANEALTSVRTASSDTWPEAVALLERVSLERQPEQVTGRLRFDTEFDDQIRTLVSALASQVFGVSAQPSSLNGSESIEDNPTAFGPASRSDLQAFSSYSDNASTMAWTDGPFGLEVNTLSLNDDGRLVIELEAEGRGLPNLGANTELVSLSIRDVTDTNGTTLLESGRCKPGHPLDATTLSQVSQGFGFKDGESVQYSTVTGTKALPLADGVTADQVDQIRGVIDYRMPTRVERFVVEPPLAGQVIETDTLRLHFSKSNASSVSYRVSGDTHRLLAVRGLNDDGQVLSVSSRTWGENWLGDGKNASVSVRGEIDQVEVFIATTLESISVPFTLDNPYPPMTSSFNKPQETISAVDAGTFDRSVQASPPDIESSSLTPEHVVTAGPGSLALQRFQVSDFQGLYAQMQLFVPNSVPVSHQLTGAVISFTSARLPDGRTRALNATTPVSLNPDGGYWTNGNYVSDPERPWWRGYATLQMPDYEGESPSTILGQIRYQAPLAITLENLSSQLGSRWTNGAMTVEVQQWRAGEVVLKLEGQTDRLLTVQALNASGERIDNDVSLSTMFGETTLGVTVEGRPEALQLVLADQVAQRAYPFELELD